MSATPRALVIAAVLVAFATTCAPASAHLRSGTVAVDYRATIGRPATAAYSAQIFQSDHGLSLKVRPAHVVELVGYLGEPVFRLDRRGAWVNAGSPTALAVGLLPRAETRAGGTPRWLLRPGLTRITWHDARVRPLPAGEAAGRWAVPLIVDGRPALLAGRLRRFPPPPVWLWSAIFGAVLLSAVLALRSKGPAIRKAAFGCAGIAAAAAVVLALAFALDSYASPGTWVLGLNAIALMAAGLWAAARGPEQFRLGAAIGVGLLATSIALIDIPVFLHAIVLAVLPADAIRALAVAAMGLGTGAAVLAGAAYLTQAAPTSEPERGLQLAPGSRPGGIVRR